MSDPTFEHVDYLWDDAEADALDPVERLRYRSNLLGRDQRMTNTGGGNTSSKVTEIDPLTGNEVRVMYVKGSGGDLRTATRVNFASLYMDKLMAQREIYLNSPDRGLKTPVEDAMVAMYKHSVFNLNPRASSIDTPLHGFIAADHVDHTHPIAAIAVAASADQEHLTTEIYGDEIGYVPWLRPGFELGLLMETGIEENPDIKGFIMGQHGLINWANDDKECYELSLRLTDQAARYIEEHERGADTFGGAKYQSLSAEEREDLLVELLPRLRGMVSQNNKFIGTVHVTDSVLEYREQS